MTCEPHNTHFGKAFPISTLVLVGMRKSACASRMGLYHSETAGVLANCRAALAYARRIGWPVAFARNVSSGAGRPSNEWIKGFEPQRTDALFDYVNASCYSSPYFERNVRETGGSVVFAGFFDRGGCLSTCADAFLAGQHVTFLADATLDDISKDVCSETASRLLKSFTTFEVTTQQTAAWIQSLGYFPALEAEAGRRSPN